MAEKLSIQIALEGGDEIQKQLADIGEAGQKAFLDIAKSAEKAGGFKNLKPEEVTKKLKDMGVVGVDALNKIQNAVAGATRIERLVGIVQKLETGFAALGGGIAGVARALGPVGIAAAAAFGAIVKGAINAAEAINKIDTAAINAGMSVQNFDRLRQGFERAGVSANGVAQAMQGIAEKADASALKLVTDAIKTLTEASNDFGTAARRNPDAIMLLQKAAEGVGPAADKAREALEKLTGTRIELPARSLQDFIDLTGDSVRGTAAFVEALRRMPDSAIRSKLAIDAFKGAGAELVQALRAGLITQDQFRERLGTISQEAANTSNSFVLSVNQMWAAWERFKLTSDPAQLGEMWNAFASAASQAFSMVMQGLGSLISKIGELASAAGGAIWDAFGNAGQAAINMVMGALDGLIGKFREAVEWASKLFSGGGASAGTGSTMQGYASGGTVGGRGTGTSDSNLAWVSRGEHIMPARAVQQPGVLGFLEALRRSGGNLSRVLDRMGHFALGGPVGLPAFAAGGGVGSMSHVTIQFPGTPSIGGLRAPTSVVDELRKAAAMAQVRSGGRKPSRYT